MSPLGQDDVPGQSVPDLVKLAESVVARIHRRNEAVTKIINAVAQLTPLASRFDQLTIVDGEIDERTLFVLALDDITDGCEELRTLSQA